MEEKVCVVAGMGPGMGLALCRRFGREGFAVAMLARNRERLAQFEESLREEGISATGFVADVGHRKEVASAFQRIGQQLGAPQVLVYNAFLRQIGPPSSLTETEVLASVRVNVLGALHCVRQVVSDMRYKGRGTILFSGGGSALEPPVQVAALGIGKAGLRNLSYSLHRELEAHGIHVGTVTIFDHINPGTHFDPDRIAESFWELHRQPREQWQWEVQYR